VVGGVGNELATHRDRSRAAIGVGLDHLGGIGPFYKLVGSVKYGHPILLTIRGVGIGAGDGNTIPGDLGGFVAFLINGQFAQFHAAYAVGGCVPPHSAQICLSLPGHKTAILESVEFPHRLNVKVRGIHYAVPLNPGQILLHLAEDVYGLEFVLRLRMEVDDRPPRMLEVIMF